MNGGSDGGGNDPGVIRESDRADEGQALSAAAVVDIKAAADEDAWAELGPLHILVAEDYRLNQKVINAMLSDLGHRISIANNGQEAVSAVLRSPYDIILMDVHMPEMDGKTAARRIRALPRPEGDIPIIALTADASMDQQGECLDAGMNDYLTKPIILPDLLAAIAKCLKTSKGSAHATVVPVQEPARDNAKKADAAAAPIVDTKVMVEFAAMVGWDTVIQLFETLAKDFVEHRNIITRAAANGEIEVLRRQTQALNGALGQFGATKAQETAHVIETLCKAGYSEAACDLIPQFLQLGNDSIDELRKFMLTMSPATVPLAASPTLSL